MALPIMVKEPDLFQCTSALSKKKIPAPGVLARTRFTKPRPNVRALSNKTSTDAMPPKQEKIKLNEKDQKSSELTNHSLLSPVKVTNESLVVPQKNEIFSDSKTDQHKVNFEVSSSDLPIDSSIEVEVVDDSTPCDGSVKDMPVGSKRLFDTTFEGEILSSVETNETCDSSGINILKSPKKVIISEMTSTPRKKFANASSLILPDSETVINCESVTNEGYDEITVFVSMCDEESVDNPPTCATEEDVEHQCSENHHPEASTDKEIATLVVNDITECSPLKNVSNSPRKRGASKKTRERRKHVRKIKTALPQNEMRMADLIHYNPDGTPMKHRSSQTNVVEEGRSNENSAPVEEEEVGEDSSVPRVVIGENGEIILDESSLVIRRKEVDFSKASVEIENDDTTYSSFRKKISTKWSSRDTFKFYKALTIVGTDFALMEMIFKNDWKIKKSRRELKSKFKLEERHNPKYVYKAMYESQMWDVTILQNDSDDLIDSSDIEDEPPISQKDSQLNEVANEQKDGEEPISTEGPTVDDHDEIDKIQENGVDSISTEDPAVDDNGSVTSE